MAEIDPESYAQRLVDKKNALDAIDRQIEILQNARVKRQQDYDEERTRQEEYKKLITNRESVQAKLNEIEHGTPDWYSVFAELEKIDKNINKAHLGRKRFW